MIIDLFNKWKVLAQLNLAYPRFFSAKFNIYRYVLVFGITNKVRYNKTDYYMAFGDYENEPLNELYRKIKKIIDDHKLGIVLVFQSSKGKYHFIAPKLLDSFAESIHISKELGSHKEYLNFSALKGQFALRITRKHHKDEPKLIGVIYGKESKDIMISKDFATLMRLNYNFHEDNFDIFKLVDSEIQFTKYNTYNS
jgi:hypothetical protein